MLQVALKVLHVVCDRLERFLILVDNWKKNREAEGIFHLARVYAQSVLSTVARFPRYLIVVSIHPCDYHSFVSSVVLGVYPDNYIR